MNRIFSISLQFSNKCIIRSIPNVNITQVRNKVTAKASKGKGGGEAGKGKVGGETGKGKGGSEVGKGKGGGEAGKGPEEEEERRRQSSRPERLLSASPRRSQQVREDGQRCALVCYSQRESAQDAIEALKGVYKIREGAERPIEVAWAKR